MDFRGRRVEAHNTWPAATEFRAEAEFRTRLAARHGQSPFRPIALSANQDADYQRCVGHLIDGLDALPNRPDYFFDHCFKLLDVAQSQVAPSKGIKGATEKLPAALLPLDTASWEQIADELGRAIPRVTVDFLAKRLLQAHAGQGPYAGQLRGRAEECMGQQFYLAFCKKYLNDQKGQPLADFRRNIPAAGSLLRLYLSGQAGTRGKKASVPVLDVRANPVSAVERMKVLLSLLLFTVRNERTHGTVISPFRTSKANLERYSSYYYLMLVAYVFALGTLALRFPNKSVSSKKILAGCIDNLHEQDCFFDDALSAPVAL